MKASTERLVISGMIVAALTFISSIIVGALTSNLNDHINRKWAFPLHEGQNDIFVKLPSTAYEIRISQEPYFWPDADQSNGIPAKISYMIQDSDGGVIVERRDDTRSFFSVKKEHRYKPLRITVDMEGDGEEPAYLVLGGSK